MSSGERYSLYKSNFPNVIVKIVTRDISRWLVVKKIIKWYDISVAYKYNVNEYSKRWLFYMPQKINVCIPQ